ncbi:hypothetical protein LAWI1_G008407 [Lachnellula willkommii]|uniref:Kinesin light chain n=1 Tax=Lachnellula willkommii TaxID=215461 RepID=A0A559LZY4_9HELO|nr:hypothetical protein LAWI1_G008407 [Lachnellula willkommii]
MDMDVRKALWSECEAILTPVLINCGFILDTMRQDSRLELLLRDIFAELGQDPAKPSMEYVPLYDLQARNLYNRWKVREAVALGEQYAYMENGQVEEAIALLEHIVKIKETLVEDHPSRLASQNMLGRAYMENGQVEEAIALLEHIVKINEIALLEDNPNRLAL